MINLATITVRLFQKLPLATVCLLVAAVCWANFQGIGMLTKRPAGLPQTLEADINETNKIAILLERQEKRRKYLFESEAFSTLLAADEHQVRQELGEPEGHTSHSLTYKIGDELPKHIANDADGNLHAVGQYVTLEFAQRKVSSYKIFRKDEVTRPKGFLGLYPSFHLRYAAQQKVTYIIDWTSK